MMDFIRSLLSSPAFMPHGHCYLWTPSVLWLHVISDALIALAYFSIPLGLFYFMRKRRDMNLGPVVGCFAVFIFACGTSHLLEIWNVWHSAYWLAGGVKLITAVASFSTALLLARLIPTAIALPSHAQWRQANATLEAEILTRRNAEQQVRELNADLERRVAERTADSRRQEAELQTILDGVPALIFFKDREHRLVKVNAELARLVGLSREEIEGRTDAELGSPGAERYRKDEQEIIETGEPKRHIIEPLFTKSGVRWLQTDKVPQRDETGRVVGIVGFALDVTDRMEAEKAAALLSAIVQSSFDAIVGKDLSGTVTSWNKGAERMFGYSSEEIIGTSITRIIPDERREEEERILARVKSGEMVEHFDTVRVKKDGTLLDVSVTVSPIKNSAGEIVGASKVARDITESRRQDEFVRQERDFSETLLNSLPGVVYLYDETGKFLRWNKNFERVTGYASEEIARMHPLDFFAGKERELLASRIGEVFEKGSSDVEAGFVTKDGRQIPYYFTGLTAKLNGKNCLVGVGIDITARKLAEKARQDSEDRMRLATEATSVGIWEWNVVTNQVRWDAQMFRIYGVEPTEDGIVDYSVWYDAVMPEDVEREDALLKETVRQCGRSAREFRIIRANDEEPRYIAAVETVRTGQDGRAEWVVGTNLDITERKLSERALRESEELFAKSFRLSPDCVAIVRLPDRTVIRANDALCQLWGSTPSEVIGRQTLEYSNWVSTEERDAFMKILVEQGECMNFETTLHMADGRLLEFNISSRMITFNRASCVLTVMRDITERKRAEKARIASELRYRRLFETSNDGILVLDAAAGIVVDANPFLTTMLGHPRDQFVGKKFWELGFFNEVVAGEAAFGEFRERDYLRFENLQLESANGQRIDADFISNSYLVDDTKVIQCNLRDVTARRQAEEALLQLNTVLEHRVTERTAQLEAANKELEAFSYSVSHDLRAPLRTMDGFSQALVEDFGAQLPEDARRYLDTIRKGAQRMGNLIDDLLTFARLSRAPLSRQEVQPSRLVREIWADMASMRAGREVELREGALPLCLGDVSLLTQVWVNLLSNALKYSRLRTPAVIEVGSSDAGGETVYFVRDNGTGFDMRYAHKLFGVFQRLHRAEEYEGTGVGLAIVQRVIHRHGGRIWAEAEPGRGATFYFTLSPNADAD